MSFKPLIKTPAISSEDGNSFTQRTFHVENFKNMKYIVWSLSVSVALFGYTVPFVHLIKYAEEMVHDMSLVILEVR